MSRLFSVLVLLTVFAVDHAPANALSPGDAGCRKALGGSALKLAATVLKEQQRCHKLRMGNLDPVNYPATVDCNDVQSLSAKAQAKITKAATKIATAAQKKCQGVASAPSALGFTICRAPCDALPITSTYASVAACLACEIQSLAGGLDLDLYGALPDPPVQTEPNDRVKCQATIASLANKIAFTRNKIQQKCQYQEDGGALSTNCITYDPKIKVAKLQSQVIGKLNGKCTAADLGALGSCGNSHPTEAACIGTEARQRGRRALRRRLRAAGRADADPDRDAGRDADRDGDADPDRDVDAHGHRDGDRDAECDGHRDADSHADPVGDGRDPDPDRDGDADAHREPDADHDRDRRRPRPRPRPPPRRRPRPRPPPRRSRRRRRKRRRRPRRRPRRRRPPRPRPSRRRRP